MFLVVLHRSGPRYLAGTPLEEQSGWDEHAAFMDARVVDGFVVHGGPLADEHRVVLVIDAPDEAVVRARLADDPWHESHLIVASIEPWTIRLDGRGRGLRHNAPG